MKDYFSIADFGLGVTMAMLFAFIWKQFLKQFFEKYYEHALSIKRQEVVSLMNMKEIIAEKRLEFLSIKLERALPLLEMVNEYYYNYLLLNSTYLNAVGNRLRSNDELEVHRVKLDGDIILAVSKLSIYLPNEFRLLLLRMRVIVSCYFYNSVVVHDVLKSCGGVTVIVESASNLALSYLQCYQEICAKYLGASETYQEYKDILKKYGLDEEANPILENPADEVAWKYILSHELYSSSEKHRAHLAAEEYFKNDHGSN